MKKPVYGTREHNSWRAMRERCYNKNSNAYINYGGRGISVCDRWRDSFENFLSDMGKCPDGLTLERKDNNQGYSPSNCIWATRSAQSRNKRRWVAKFSYAGRTQHLVDWAKELGISASTLHNRIHILGWSLGDALTSRKSHKWSRRSHA